MKKPAASSLVLLASLCSAPVMAIDATPHIVNGTDTTTNSYKSFASLFFLFQGDDDSYLYGNSCGATILDAQHILTAAHCVSSQDVSELDRLFTAVIPRLDNITDFSVSDTSSQYWISDIYVHPSYDSDELENDIAVVKLVEPISGIDFETVQFINQTSYRSDGAATYTAVGHGYNLPNQRTTYQLQEADLTLVDNASCGYHGVSGTDPAPDTQLCMEGSISDGYEAATCNGDSGGPLYWESGSTQYQVGITSYGPLIGCGSTSFSGATSVFTETWDYSDWIDDAQNGLVTAEYSPSESDREYYRANYTVTGDAENGYQLVTTASLETSSGGGGGSLSLWSLLLLGSGLVLRRNRRQN